MLLLAAAAALAGWQAVKSAALSALEKDDSPVAVSLAPEDPRVAFALGMAEINTRQGRISEATAAAVRAGLARAPLAHEPFFIAGLDALTQGKEQEAEILLAESLRRNPRSRLTRLILLDRYLRTGRVGLATAQITILSALIPGAKAVLVAELAKFAADRSTLPALQNALHSKPELIQAVLVQLATKRGDPAIILDLWNRNAAVQALPGNDRWQSALVQGLVDRGDIAEAQRIWRGFAPGAAAPSANLLYDPAFGNLAAPPPFGWRLASGSAGVAEPAAGALQVDYFGRRPIELAGQLLVLPPGRYRFEFRAEGEASGEGSQLQWSITCGSARTQLVRIPIAGLTYTPKPFSVSFTVPAGNCAVQRLALRGTPGEFPKDQTASLAQLQIVRSSAR